MKQKAIILLLVSTLLVSNVFAQKKKTTQTNTQTTTQNSRKKVALVLSGGGAKGTAHIGALKVLEKANIPIDMIVGTSMGSLMGGLYCIGYDASMLDSLVRIQDWPFLLSDKIDPNEQNILQRDKNDTYAFSFALNNTGKLSFASSGFIKGKNLSNLFARLTLGYHDSIDFNTLPIPFACVATDITDFSEVVFHSGTLATAMRSSMSIPAVFSPVYLDSMVLVDGGLLNNYPVDVAKAMGADIIIGVSVQNDIKKEPEKFSSTLSIVNQLTDIGNLNKTEENIAMTDVFIKVDVKGYSAASFNVTAIDSLIKRGEQAAMDKWDDLIKLKQKIGIDTSFVPQRIRPYHTASQNIRMRISDVTFSNIDPVDSRYLVEKFHLERGKSTTISDLEKVMIKLRTNLFYKDASYKIEYKRDGYAIRIESEGKKAAEISMGVRFDNEEKVSLQFNAIKPINLFVPSMLAATLRLGTRSMAKIEATFNPSSFASFSLVYTYRHNDMDIYHNGSKDFNSDYNQHQVDFGIMDYGFKNFLFDIYARWDYYYYKTILIGNRSRKPFVSASHLFSYHAKLHYDNCVSKYFSSRGQKFEVHYALYTDNFYKYNNNTPLSEVSFNFKKIFPIIDNLVITPTLYGRGIYGEEIPTILQNAIGGHFFGHYIEQQVPFAGIGNIEVANNNFVAFELNTRYRIFKNNYVSFAMALGQSAEEIGDIFSVDPLFGVRASYAYNTIIGPIGLSLGYSTRTKETYMFVNIGYEF